MRVIKPYSLIAWFVVLNTSFKDPKLGSRVFRFIPNTPVLTTWGQKPTTGQLLGLIYKMAAQEEKLPNNRQ